MDKRATRLAHGWHRPASRTRTCWQALALAVLMAGCVTTAPKPDATGSPAPSAATGAATGAATTPAAPNTPGAPGAPGSAATPAPPKPVCQPEPFCMSDCKRQGYPTGYCNLRCGC